VQINTTPWDKYGGIEVEVREILKNMDYGPAPESSEYAEKWLEGHNRTLDLYINGTWQAPGDGTYFDAVNPSNKQVMAKIAAATKEDVNQAVKAAKAAQPKWYALGGHARARFLYAIARQIQKHSRLFSVVETMDNGKPIRESRDVDIPVVARHLLHHAGWAQVMESEFPDYEPVGVVGGITPWNFPLMLFTWKVAPALAMGNTIVVKPAKLTSLTTILFAEICHSIGLPPGVLNIVTGSGSKTGSYIVDHPSVNKISFTGSTEVGQVLRRQIAGSGKKITLELGGKSPFVVFDDADLDSAVEGVVNAIWFNQGQVCCAGSRLLVQETVYDTFIEKVKARMNTLRVGDPLDKAVDIGAVVDQVQWDTINDYVEIGIKEGGDMWQPDWKCPTEGFYYLPTLFTNVSPSDTVVIEEIFGPVLVAIPFRTPAEAVQLANNTKYGLAASVWSENINLALDIAPQIKAGSVWINCTNLFDASSGFGGYRESGFGREGGEEGIWDYIKPKWEKKFRKSPVTIPLDKGEEIDEEAFAVPEIDKTPKMYIGGKQVRPDYGYSITIKNPQGKICGEVGQGNRKDIRNAVEAAHKESKWLKMKGHNRAQVLYFIAENLLYRADEFTKRLIQVAGIAEENAREEVNLSINRLFYYAAMTDKYDSRVHNTPFRNVTLAMKEPIGVMGIACPTEFPLLGLISTVIPAIAMGNRVIVIPSEQYPLLATDFYQILETSDLPGGTINIVTGARDELLDVLAKHDDVDGIWYWGSGEMCKTIEYEAATNMKRTWLNFGLHRDWMQDKQGQGEEFLRKATEIKNIWVPYGE
jgi:aldehyde dehydrogenase (NAD+)